MDNKDSGFLNKPLIIINIGVKSFSYSLEDQSVDFIHVDWEPPAGGDEEMMDLLDELL